MSNREIHPIEELGLKDKCALNKSSVLEGSKLSFSDSFQLAASIDGKMIAGRVVECIPTSEKSPRVISIMMRAGEQSQSENVGYITYGWNAETPQEATLSVNLLKTKAVQEHLELLPQDIVQSIQQGTMMNALEVSEEYRGKKIGALLWIFGLAYLHSRGFKKIGVEGDVTIGGDSSFYTKYGTMVKEGYQIIETEKIFDYLDEIRGWFGKKR